jgi:hypothetical protein
MLHNVEEVMAKYGQKLYIGDIGVAQHKEPKKPKRSEEAFGEMVPLGDPTWYQDWYS